MYKNDKALNDLQWSIYQSDPQNFSDYSSRFKQCFGLDGLDSSSDFQFLMSFFLVLGDRSKHANHIFIIIIIINIGGGGDAAFTVVIIAENGFCESSSNFGRGFYVSPHIIILSEYMNLSLPFLTMNKPNSLALVRATELTVEKLKLPTCSFVEADIWLEYLLYAYIYLISHRKEAKQGLFSSRIKLVWNQSFLSPKMVAKKR